MRSIEFATLLEELSWLFEDKRDFILSRQSEQLVAAYKSETGQEAEASAVIDVLMGALPNPNDQSFLVWIVNQYLKSQFKSSEVSVIKEILAGFVKVKPKLEKKDIGQYKTVEDLRVAVDALKDADLRSNKEKERQFRDMLFKTGEAELIHRDSELIVISPKTHRASCYFGTNTKWCTASKDSPHYFDQYNKKGPLFIFIYQKKKYQLNIAKNGVVSFLDETDQEFNSDLKYSLISQVPVILDTLEQKSPKFFSKVKMYMLSQSGDHNLDHVLSSPYVALQYVLTHVKKPWPEGEEVIAKDPLTALDYSIKVLKSPFPAGEPAIASTADTAIRYASVIIKGRWKLGERVILTRPAAVLKYIATVVKKRWPAGERVIIKNPKLAVKYASSFLRKRWPEAEEVIAKNAELSLKYASEVIKGPWPEGEAEIAKDVNHAINYVTIVTNRPFPAAEKEILSSRSAYSVVEYAIEGLKKRWPEGEKVILSSTDSYNVTRYAKLIIKGRWPEGEKVILSSDEHWSAIEYANEVLKGRWPELEKRLISTNTPEKITSYAIQVIKGRWPEGEKILLSSTDYHSVYLYARDVIKGRWPEAEQMLKQNPKAYQKYQDLIK